MDGLSNTREGNHGGAKMKQRKSSLVQAIRAANQEKAAQVDQHSGIPERENAGIPDTADNPQDRMVNLSIKVNKSLRLHWLLEAKKQGTSLTEAIVSGLTARFGDHTK